MKKLAPETPNEMIPARRELASRVSAGIEVTLYWSAHDNSTSIEVWDPASAETLVFGVPREQALEAFYHPFAHLPQLIGISAEWSVSSDTRDQLNSERI
jgi:hypothetical protein